MHQKFAAIIDALHPAFEQLVGMEPARGGQGLPPVRTPGIYLFSEHGTDLYIGRTNDLRGRYGGHCNPGATYHSATFAFRLARETTGFHKATYRAGEGSRSALAVHPGFSEALTAAKARIRQMDYRFVAEADPVRQTILEVYCAVVLETRYNDFDNH